MSHQHQVRSVMKTNVATVHPETPFKAAAALLAAWGVSGAPVVDSDGLVIGVVSQGDLLERKAGRARRRRFHHRLHSKATGRFVADLMTAPAITVDQEADVSRAARLLEEHRIHRLPVVDSAGKLAGLVTRGDLLRVFLRPDTEIRAEIREEVIERVMCVDPRDLFVSVHNGVVTLKGQLERASLVTMLLEFARRVDGVVEVRNELTAKLDDTRLGEGAAAQGNVGVFGAMLKK
ncbi:CBS domain-containing protein [Amycolatopsis sp. NPDC059027]|uniref:CBS domain-containing protein n=1 Tax=unclassified Amycolatopsis TaxID=2618356 RepID=UPI00366EE9A8